MRDRVALGDTLDASFDADDKDVHKLLIPEPGSCWGSHIYGPQRLPFSDLAKALGLAVYALLLSE